MPEETDLNSAVEARMNNLLSSTETMFQRMDDVLSKDPFETTKPVVSRGRYVSQELDNVQLSFYSNRKQLRENLSHEYEQKRRLNGSWDGQLTPAEGIEIDSKVDQQYPMTPDQREMEFRLQGDPNWHRYDPKVQLKDAGWLSMPGQIATLGNVNNINKDFDKLPEGVKNVVSGTLLGVENGFVSAYGYMADTALALTDYASGAWAIDRFMGAGDGSIIYSARKSLQKTMENVKEHYFQDLRGNRADPNRALEYKLNEEGYLQWAWDDRKFGNDAWYSPVSIAQFGGNLLGQYLALGLFGRAAGAIRGVSSMAPVEAAKFMENTTAAAMTAIGISQASQTTKQMLMAKGMKETDAQARGDLVGALYAPVGFMLNKISPETQLLSRGAIAQGSQKIINNFPSMIIRGALTNMIQGGADEAWRQIEYNTFAGDWSARSVWQSSKAVIESAGIGAATGTFFGGLSALRRTYDRPAFVNKLDNIEKYVNDIDALGIKDLYWQARNLGLDKNQASVYATVLDNLVQVKARRDGTISKEAYADILANKSQRDALPSSVLVDGLGKHLEHFSSLETLFSNSQFIEQIGKGVTAHEFYRLANEHLGSMGMWSTGLMDWYQTNGDNTKLWKPEEIGKLLNERLDSIVKVRDLPEPKRQEIATLNDSILSGQTQLKDLLAKLKKAKDPNESLQLQGVINQVRQGINGAVQQKYGLLLETDRVQNSAGQDQVIMRMAPVKSKPKDGEEPTVSYPVMYAKTADQIVNKQKTLVVHELKFSGDADPELAVKMMMHHAVKGGYDQLAFAEMPDTLQIQNKTKAGEVISGYTYQLDGTRNPRDVAQDIAEKLAPMVGGLKQAYDIVDKVLTDLNNGQAYSKLVESARGNKDLTDALTSAVTITAKKNPVTTMKVDPKSVEDLQASLPVYSENKASVIFVDGARAILKALKDPDLSSLINKLASIARRHFVDPTDHATLERMFGVKNGIWTPKAEQQFAKTFEAYFRGKIGYDTIKDPRSIAVLDTIKDYMQEIYKTASDIKGAKEINTEFEGIIRRMFVKESNSIREAEAVAIEHEDRLTAQLKSYSKAREKLLAGRKEEQLTDDEKAQLLEMQKKNVTAREERDKARSQLRDMVEREFDPRKGTLAQERAKQYAHIEELANKDFEKTKSFLDSKTIRWLRGAYDVSNIMHRTEAAKWFVELLDDMDAENRAITGQFHGALHDVYFEQLSSRQRQELALIDEKTGLPAFVLMYGGKGVTGRITMPDWAGNVGRMFNAIHDLITNRMLAAGAMRRLPSGDTVPVKESMTRSIPRIMTSDGYSWMSDPGSPEYKAWKEKVIELNPGVSEKEYSRWFRNEIGHKNETGDLIGRAVTRRQGFVEGSRTIQNIPFAVKVDGQWKHFFHTDPFEIASRWIENGVRRATIIKHMGQGMMKDVSEVQTYAQKILGLIGKNLKPLTHDEMAAQLEDRGLGDINDLKKMTNKQLIQMHEDMGLDYKPTHEEILGEFNKLSFRDFQDHKYAPDENLNDQLKRSAIAQLVKIGRKIGGVDTYAHLGELIDDLKQRMNEKIMDDVYDKLVQAHIKQGGNREDMDRTWNLFQGRPMYVPSNSLGGRIAQTASTVVESSLTSLSTLSNAFQFLAASQELVGGRITNVPRALKETVQTFYELAKTYDSVKKYGIDMGAFRPTLQRFASDSSYWLTRASQVMRTFTGKAFLAARTSEFLNVASLRMGQFMTERWMKNFDVNVEGVQAKRLNLSEDDIKQWAAGGVTPDSMVYKKTLQNFIKRTQGVTEAAHHKGMLEVNPWLKMLFSFSSYMNLQNRRIEATTSQVYETFQNFKKNPSKGTATALAAATSTIMASIAFAVGGGELNRLLKDAVHQRQPDTDNEDWWHRVIKDLSEYQLIGHAARFIELGDHPQGIMAPIMAQSPLLSSVSQFITAAYGGGRYSKYPFYERFARTYLDMLPAYNAYDRMREYSNYPDRALYDETRQKTMKWEQSQSWYEQNANQYAVNPVTYQIYQQVARGDWQEAQKLVAAYMKEAPKIALEQGKDPGEVLSNLRQSLMSRRPINLQPRQMYLFLKSVPKEKRQVYINANAKYVSIVNAIAPAGN